MVFTLYATRLFENDLKHLDSTPSFQERLLKIFHYLQDDPRLYQRSLRTETLKRLRKSGYDIFKSRVDQYYRIAWRYEGQGAIVLLRVGDHKLINEYATFNESDIVRTIPPQADSEIGIPSQDTEGYQTHVAPAVRIFGDWRPVHLHLLGVPEEKARAVKLITDIDQVYDLGLPDYAVKNLVDAFLLEDWTTDHLFDSSFIFYRTNADQLEGYCRGEIKQLLLNLSPEQDRLVSMQTTGPTLIKGVAGSGKTTVGIYRAMAQTHIRDLFHQKRDPRVLFITFNETLARVVEQMFVEIYGQEQAKRVEVWVLRDWLQEYLEGKPGTRPLASRSEIINAVGQGIFKARQRFPDSAMSKERGRDGGKGRGNDFFISEIADVIKGRNLRTWEQYSKANRTGRKTGLGEHPRRFIWTVYEEYERQLEKIGKFDYLDLSLYGIKCLEKAPDFRPYDAVVVDEAQDLRPVELQVVSLLAGGANARNLILLADPSQSIYYKGIPWKDGNIHIAPARSLSLSRNYRNTRQILQAAWSLAQSQTSDDLDEETITPDASNRYGPRPSVIHCQNNACHDRFVIETIKQLCSYMQYRPGDIAVLARKNDLVNHLRVILTRTGLPVVHFRADDFDIFENNIKVVTLNSAKGLEFPVVFLAGLNEGELPRHLYADDEEELTAELRSERRLLYVGMTRAAHRLYMVCQQQDASRFIDEIDPDTIRVIHYGDEIKTL